MNDSLSNPSDPAPSYTTPAIILHWLVAIAVIALFILGWYMVDLPKGPARGEAFALHKSIGLTVLALLGLRIYWRMTHPPPALPGEVPRWQRALAGGVHLSFYCLLVLQPVSGYLSSSFSGYRTHWFGLKLPHWGWRDAPLNELFTEIHVIGSIVLLVLVGMHLMGILSHLLAGQFHLLRRMWPWGRKD